MDFAPPRNQSNNMTFFASQIGIRLHFVESAKPAPDVPLIAKPGNESFVKQQGSNASALVFSFRDLPRAENKSRAP